MGISIAGILGMIAGGMGIMLVLYSIPGILGRFFKGLGRWGAIIGGFFGLYLIMTQYHFCPEITKHALPWEIGMASFLFIPRRCLSHLSSCFPEATTKEEAAAKQKFLEKIITERLAEVATVFADFSQNLEKDDDDEGGERKTDLYSLLDQVCNRICQHCNGYESCWGENFYSTYREMFDLIARAELEGEIQAPHVKGRLSKSCFQQFKLVNTINQMLENYQTGMYWHHKIEDSKFFIANQIQVMSDFIKTLAEQITKDSGFKAEIEIKLKTGFDQAGIYIKDIAINSFEEDGLEIHIKRRNCNQKHECQWLMAPVVSQLLGTEYMVWEKRCNLGKDECAYCLIPKRTYVVRTTVCKMPKSGNEFSGDSHALHELKDGFFVSILSDGMGHGKRAAQESNSTVSILERLLDTGIDRNFAIKMVNTMMSLRSPEESFATVDLTIINLYNGNSEFLKVGAATTYIKRGREVWTIKSTSLPAGILNTVDVEKTTMRLLPGDLVIMVTDGVTDSKLDSGGKDEWMKRALSKVEVVGPEALGEYLLNLARINQDGIPRDDMTVIVLQLTENKEFMESF